MILNEISSTFKDQISYILHKLFQKKIKSRKMSPYFMSPNVTSTLEKHEQENTIDQSHM